MAYWTYASEVDATNGGADNLTVMTLVSGLPSGLIDIEIMWTDLSTNAASTAGLIQLGDAGGFEATNYHSSAGYASEAAAATTGFLMSTTATSDAADSMHGCMSLFRYNAGDHLWLMRGKSGETTSTPSCIEVGSKTLSGEITQIQLTTIAGTAVFDGGAVIVRYV